MPPRSSIRRLAPWLLGLALLAWGPPAAWAYHADTASDGEVHPDSLIVEATAEGPVDHLPPGPERREPLYNLTVHRVLESPGGSDVPEAGDKLEIMVPLYKDEAEGLAQREGPLTVALRSAEKHYPENGTVYWAGWALEDTRDGRYWSPQGEQLEGALGTLGVSTASAVLAGAALWAYGPRRLREGVNLTAPLAALLLALLFAGTVANSAGQTNSLFDAHFDGPPAPGPAGFVVGLALPALGIWGSRSGPPGARTALIGGLGLLLGVAHSILWLWPPRAGSILDGFGFLALWFLPVAVLGATAARWLPGRRVRRFAAVALALASAGVFVWMFPMGLFITIPLLGVVTPCVGELFGPSVWEASEDGTVGGP